MRDRLIERPNVGFGSKAGIRPLQNKGFPTQPIWFILFDSYLPFAALAVAGFRTTMWLVVAGLAGHGVLDHFYPTLVAGRGVPAFWPVFCMAYDLVAAACLAALIVWRGNQAGVSPSP